MKEIVEPIESAIISKINSDGFIKNQQFSYEIEKIKDKYGGKICKLPEPKIIYSGNEFDVRFEGTFDFKIKLTDGNLSNKNFSIQTFNCKVQYDLFTQEFKVLSLGNLFFSDR